MNMNGKRVMACSVAFGLAAFAVLASGEASRQTGKDSAAEKQFRCSTFSVNYAFDKGEELIVDVGGWAWAPVFEAPDDRAEVIVDLATGERVIAQGMHGNRLIEITFGKLGKEKHGWTDCDFLKPASWYPPGKQPKKHIGVFLGLVLQFVVLASIIFVLVKTGLWKWILHVGYRLLLAVTRGLARP